MYKEVLRNIDQVAVWPILSLLIFFTFFVLMLWRVFSTDKKTVNEISRLPLHETDNPTDQTLKS
jgi:cbb3-type cytochrome oxidase subunit 3